MEGQTGEPHLRVSGVELTTTRKHINSRTTRETTRSANETRTKYDTNSWPHSRLDGQLDRGRRCGTVRPGERNDIEEGKFVIYCEAYPSINNTSTEEDKPLTKPVRVTPANGQFVPTHQTKMRVSSGKSMLDVPALRNDKI